MNRLPQEHLPERQDSVDVHQLPGRPLDQRSDSAYFVGRLRTCACLELCGVHMQLPPWAKSTSGTMFFLSASLLDTCSVPGELLLHGQPQRLPAMPGRLQHAGLHRCQQVHQYALPAGPSWCTGPGPAKYAEQLSFPNLHVPVNRAACMAGTASQAGGSCESTPLSALLTTPWRRAAG